MQKNQKRFPLVLNKETSEGLLTKKSSYTPPNVKVVDFVVESGFEASTQSDVPVDAGNRFYLENTDEFRQTDNTDYHWQTASDGWF